MTNTKTIENYDQFIGRSIVDEKNPLPKFTGTDIDGKHYVVDAVDVLMGTTHGHEVIDYANTVLSPDLGIKKDGLRVPRRAYELISYDENTKVAVVREIRDQSLIERIVVEMEKDRVLTRVLKWQGQRKREDPK